MSAQFFSLSMTDVDGHTAHPGMQSQDAMRLSFDKVERTF